MRLTEEELIDKRGTCLLCDETFEVSPGDVRGEIPYREHGLALAAVDPEPLVCPDVREDAETHELELRPAGFAVKPWKPLALILPLLSAGVFVALELMKQIELFPAAFLPMILLGF